MVTFDRVMPIFDLCLLQNLSIGYNIATFLNLSNNIALVNSNVMYPKNIGQIHIKQSYAPLVIRYLKTECRL